jgi:hypothetical protein
MNTQTRCLPNPIVTHFHAHSKIRYINQAQPIIFEQTYMPSNQEYFACEDDEINPKTKNILAMKKIKKSTRGKKRNG